MATFKGTVTSVSQIQSGTSKSGKQWQRVDVVLTYDNSKPEYPKSILFSVMNDNIAKFNLQQGCEYEVEVDFSTREYNNKTYMSASCWKATSTQQAPAQPEQPGWQASYPQPAVQSQPATPVEGADDLPF